MCVCVFVCVCVAGVLLGIAIRTGSPLSLYLAEPVWKQLAGMNLTIADLSEVITSDVRPFIDSSSYTMLVPTEKPPCISVI